LEVKKKLQSTLKKYLAELPTVLMGKTMPILQTTII